MDPSSIHAEALPVAKPTGVGVSYRLTATVGIKALLPVGFDRIFGDERADGRVVVALRAVVQATL